MSVLLAAGGAASAQDHAGQYAAADIAYGARLYADNCSTCHGVDGDAVTGVSFRSGQLRHASSDRDLQNVIANGIPDTAMPPGAYNPGELTGLVAFLRTMGDVDPGTIAIGDPTRGRQVLLGPGECLSCHRVGRDGSRVGPDLTDIGVVRSAGSLERTLLDPNAALLPINRSIRAVTSDGRVVTGRRLNEDTFTVQIIDRNERLVSLDKQSLDEYTVLVESQMPSYRDRLSEAQLSDLLAYLLTLKGVE